MFCFSFISDVTTV